MKQILLIFIVMMGTYATRAQYVGVNKPNPTEALDVNGNINLSGAIKINGSSGGEGQVLASNGMGGMWWLPSSSPAFTRMRVFNSNSTFYIPSDAKFIRFEVWSGGGRAVYDPEISNYYFSGGGGGYATGIVPVSPGSQLDIRVPDGQSASYLLDSAYIKIDAANRVVVRNGDKQNPGQLWVAVGVFNGSTVGIAGEPGMPHTRTKYPLVSNTVFEVRLQYANGGRAPNGGLGALGGMSGKRDDNDNLLQYSLGHAGQIPGGGGAFTVNFLGTAIASNGRQGRIILYY